MRSLSSVARERQALLRKIYAPFARLDDKSPEYMVLARSGKVWEDFFRPADSEKQGYMRMQRECSKTLQCIDDIRQSMKRPASLLSKQLVPEYALQSVQMEDNRLGVQDSYEIHDFLTKNFFRSVDLASLSLRDLAGHSLPEVTGLSPTADKSQVNELRNHIVASQWIAETATQHPGTAGLDETDVKHLSALTMKDLGRGDYFPYGWGEKV